jgi:hypothetical protein
MEGLSGDICFLSDILRDEKNQKAKSRNSGDSVKFPGFEI